MTVKVINRQILKSNGYKNKTDSTFSLEPSSTFRHNEVFANGHEPAWVPEQTGDYGNFELSFDLVSERTYLLTYVFGLNGTNSIGNYFREMECSFTLSDMIELGSYSTPEQFTQGTQLLKSKYMSKYHRKTYTPLPELIGTFTAATENTNASLTLVFDKSYTVGVGEIMGVMVSWFPST